MIVRSLLLTSLEQPFRCVVIACMVLVAGWLSTHANAEPIVWENDLVRYAISPEGRNVSFFDKVGNREQLVTAQPGVFLTARCKDQTLSPLLCHRDGDRLQVRFEGAAVSLKITCRPRHFVFTLESVEGEVDEVRLFNLLLRSGERVSWIAGLVQDENFAAAVRALNLRFLAQVHTRPTAGLTAEGSEPLPGQLAYLGAVASKQPGLLGASAILVGCPTCQVREVLQEALEREDAVRSLLGGPWALDAPENQGSYVFATVSEQNVDDWIALAKQGGIAQIHMISWEESLGHYRPRKDLFPNGLEGLRQVVEKIHAAGLKAGMHTLTGCISPNDPWVAPKPDPRLAVDARFTLAEPLDQKATRIVTHERPGDLDTVWAYGGRGNVLRVGDELIQYSGLAQEAPYGFTGCQRGAFGTVPQKHGAGVAVEHLYVRYGFWPDPESSLVDEIADAIANVYNTCQFDMIYMDGAEGMPGDWYGISLMREAIFRRLQRPALVEASHWDYHSWAFHSRLGAWDHPYWGFKPFVDWHCRSNEEHRQSALLPTQLGWWAILGPSPDHDASLPDEFEYLCVKSLAFEMPLSFQGIAPGATPPCARQPEYLEMLRQYEHLRLSNRVPAHIREKLKQQGQDFHLVMSPDASWAFYPSDFLAHKVLGSDPETANWKINNRYGPQPLRVRLQALYALEPFGSGQGEEIVSFAQDVEFTAVAQAAGVSAKLSRVTDQVKEGQAGAELVAENTGSTSRGAWAHFTKKFQPFVNMQSKGGIGVWVYGDGSGALLNFQFSNPTYFWPTRDEHYVTLDFEGWKYFELLLRERDADEFHRYVWPYGGYYAEVYRCPLIRSHVSELNLFVNEVPAQGRVRCVIGPVRALPVVSVKLANPVLTLNGQTITFPVTLRSGDYLEFDGQNPAKIYDESGKLLGEVNVQGEVPLIQAGTNEIAFSCKPDAPEGVHARAKVTIITRGDPLRP